MPRYSGLILFFVMANIACAKESSKQVFFVGTLYDGYSAGAMHNVLLTVENGTFTGLEENVAIQRLSSDMIDWRALTILPGFIDLTGNTFTSSGEPNNTSHPNTLALLKDKLRHGVTTAVYLTRESNLLSLSNFVGVAQHHGPRLWVAGEVQYASSQHIQDLAERGADVLYLSANPKIPFTPDDVCEIVKEAHTQDLRVAAPKQWGNLLTRVSPCAVDFFWNRNEDPFSTQVHINSLLTQNVKDTRLVADLTSNAAHVLGLDDAVGRIAPGYRADMIVLESPISQTAASNIRETWIDGVQQNVSDVRWHEPWLLWLWTFF